MKNSGQTIQEDAETRNTTMNASDNRKRMHADETGHRDDSQQAKAMAIKRFHTKLDVSL